MATFNLSGTDSVSGGADDDTFLVDPNDLSSVHISDDSGAQDVLVVYDRPDSDPGDLVVDGGALIFTTQSGDSIHVALNGDGTSPIETFRWERLAEDGSPYAVDLAIVLPGQVATQANSILAGTLGNDTLAAPLFGTPQGNFSQIYGGDGDDLMTGSNNVYVGYFGGAGNDTMLGVEAGGDNMQGAAGKDRLKARGGSDLLSGGGGNDKLFGGNGADVLEGGGGKDKLTGGGGKDAFEFYGANFGADVITDYTAGKDTIELFDVAEGQVQQSQVGSDVLIEVDGTASILVQNTTLADVTLDFH